MSSGLKSQSVRVHPDICDWVAKNLESLSSVRCILVKNIKLYPNQIPIKRQLTNIEKKVAMGQWFLQKIDDDEGFLIDVWFLDEVHVLLISPVTSKHLVFWRRAIPQSCLDAFCIKIAWHESLFWSMSPLDHFFFEDDRDNAMTKGRYILVLEQFSCSVSTLMRKDGGSSWIVLFFTLLMLPWHGFVKCLGGVLLSVKTSWNGRQTHLTWIPPDFFL